MVFFNNFLVFVSNFFCRIISIFLGYWVLILLTLASTADALYCFKIRNYLFPLVALRDISFFLNLQFRDSKCWFKLTFISVLGHSHQTKISSVNFFFTVLPLFYDSKSVVLSCFKCFMLFLTFLSSLDILIKAFNFIFKRNSPNTWIFFTKLVYYWFVCAFMIRFIVFIFFLIFIVFKSILTF